MSFDEEFFLLMDEQEKMEVLERLVDTDYDITESDIRLMLTDNEETTNV